DQLSFSVVVGSPNATVSVNGEFVSTTTSGNSTNFDVSNLALQAGENLIRVQVIDNQHRVYNWTYRVTYAPPPELFITSHQDGEAIASRSIVIRGTVADPTTSISVNGTPAALSGTVFTATVALVEGQNTIEVVGLTPQGGKTSKKLQDRKSTRLNSSHVKTSYAVFCLKKRRVHGQRPDRRRGH